MIDPPWSPQSAPRIVSEQEPSDIVADLREEIEELRESADRLACRLCEANRRIAELEEQKPEVPAAPPQSAAGGDTWFRGDVVYGNGQTTLTQPAAVYRTPLMEEGIAKRREDEARVLRRCRADIVASLSGE